MSYQNNLNWKHVAGDVALVGAAVCEALASAQTDGMTLPWHITAAGLVLASSVFAKVSHSLTDPSPPPVVVAVSPVAGSPAVVQPSTVVPPVAS